MALKLKQYNKNYKGLDPDYYANVKAPFVFILTNRNTGKTTNMVGYLARKAIEENKALMLIVRYKNEIEFSRNKINNAKDFYDFELEFDKDLNGFVDENGEPRIFIVALNAVQNTKNNAELFAKVDTLIFDEFLPTDNRYLHEKSQPGYEIECLKWLLGSVQKGKGEINKELKVFFLANLLSGLNPYFKAFKDSEGVSILTHLARNVKTAEQNFTIDDENIFFTLHMDYSFLGKDKISMFINGDDGKDMSNGFLESMNKNILSKKEVVNKLKGKPLLVINGVALYRIAHPVEFRYLGEVYIRNRSIFYFTKTKQRNSSLKKIDTMNLTLFPSYFDNIESKALIIDFFNEHKNTNKPIIN